MNKPITMLMLLVTICLGGCASFIKYETKKTDIKPVHGLVQETALGYNFRTHFIDQRLREQFRKDEEIRYEGYLKKVLEKSNYFKSISWGESNSDLFIDINLFIDNRPNAAALLTAASLFTVPSWQKNKFSIRCTVKNEKGYIKIYELKDTSTDVAWLPLALFPIGLSSDFDPTQTPNLIIENLFKALVMKLSEDGLVKMSRVLPRFHGQLS